jgi:hypothetical protein
MSEMGRRVQIAMDRATVAAGVFGGERIRFFRRSIQSPEWAEHLAIPSPDVPTLQVGVPSEVTVETLAGPLPVGLLLVQEASAGAPLIVTHHGNNERAFDLGRRSKNFLNRALLEGERPEGTLLLLRAPFHDGPLRAYTDASGDLRTWMSMLAASVGAADAVMSRLGRDAGRPSLLTGMSLGGWVTNLHRAFHNTASLYVPMLAGAHLGRQLVDSAYRRMVSRQALVHADELRMRLDFDAAFRAVTDDNVAALLARHDQFARLEHQADDYGRAPIHVLETGHIGAALDRPALRRHVLQGLDRLQGSTV